MKRKRMTVQKVLKIISQLEEHKSYRQTIVRNNRWGADSDLHMSAIKDANKRIKELKFLINNATIMVPEDLING